MNPYLTKVGASVKPIRMLLDWTQAELSKHTGLSRSTIINIENEPWRMTRSSSIVFFSVILTEMTRRIQQLEKYTTTEPIDWQELLQDLRLDNPRSWSHILGPVGLVATGLIPVLGGIAMVTAGTSKNLTENDHKKLKHAVAETLHELSMKLCQLFELEALSLDLFIKKLDEEENAR